MEILAQYWDDLDDLYWSFAASGEKVRTVLVVLLSILVLALVAAAGIVAALLQPVYSLAAACLMAVFLASRANSPATLKYPN